jgi:deazaflavin-dependent oxidoreductase (nitroreductase family)
LSLDRPTPRNRQQDWLPLLPTESFLYLRTVGRKTAQLREIEIWYVELEGRFYVVAERREQAAWVKNLRADARVSYSVGARGDKTCEVPLTSAEAHIVDDDVEAELAARVRGLMDAKYGWSDGLIVQFIPSEVGA